MKLGDIKVEDLFENGNVKIAVSIDHFPEDISFRIVRFFVKQNRDELMACALSLLKKQFDKEAYIKNLISSWIEEIKEEVKSIDRRTLQGAVNEAVRSFFDEHQDEMTVRINGAMEKVIKSLPSTKRFQNYFVDAVSESRQVKIDALKRELRVLEGKEEE